MKRSPNPLKTPAPWAIAWVLALATLFYLPGGREWASHTLNVPLFGGDGVLAARYLNAMMAALVSMRAFRLGRGLDGFAALFFASVLIINGSGQDAADIPFTLGIALFTVANLLICWAWDSALDHKEAQHDA